ncbi:hypothetical protein HY626_00360 [Candidatus Uhrbacteria bacterium]|nr:hypothetical protein [Candidatus Uhrbacteria bacterium]
MKFISTKELRTDLPAIRMRLAKGEEFFLIHQSKPIAKLTPIETLEEATDSDIEQAAITDMGNDFLTKEEIAYYLALK